MDKCGFVHRNLINCTFYPKCPHFLSKLSANYVCMFESFLMSQKISINIIFCLFYFVFLTPFCVLFAIINLKLYRSDFHPIRNIDIIFSFEIFWQYFEALDLNSFSVNKKLSSWKWTCVQICQHLSTYWLVLIPFKQCYQYIFWFNYLSGGFLSLFFFLQNQEVVFIVKGLYKHF